jgi:hypothetical protein
MKQKQPIKYLQLWRIEQSNWRGDREKNNCIIVIAFRLYRLRG